MCLPGTHESFELCPCFYPLYKHSWPQWRTLLLSNQSKSSVRWLTTSRACLSNYLVVSLDGSTFYGSLIARPKPPPYFFFDLEDGFFDFCCFRRMDVYPPPVSISSLWGEPFFFWDVSRAVAAIYPPELAQSSAPSAPAPPLVPATQPAVSAPTPPSARRPGNSKVSGLNGPKGFVSPVPPLSSIDSKIPELKLCMDSPPAYQLSEVFVGFFAFSIAIPRDHSPHFNPNPHYEWFGTQLLGAAEPPQRFLRRFRTPM